MQLTDNDIIDFRRTEVSPPPCPSPSLIGIFKGSQEYFGKAPKL